MVDTGAIRKSCTNTHSFIVSKVKDISLSVFAANRAPPYAKPQSDPEKISRYGHPELDTRNDRLPDVFVFPRYSYSQAKVDSMDVQLLMDHFDKERGKNRTWPPGQRCFACPECKDPTIGCTGVVVIEFLLKATPIKNYPFKYPEQRKEFTPVLIVSRFIPRMYHVDCYLAFMDKCIAWGAPEDWFSCEREILKPGHELERHPNLTMQWLDIYDALSEYDEGLREYFHREVPMFPRDESKIPKNMHPNDLHYEDPPEQKLQRVIDFSVEAKAMRDRADEAMEMEYFERAVDLYSKALMVSDVDHHFILSSRSKARLKMKKHAEAMQDANECIRLQPDWIEGYQRKGEALIAMDRKFEAIPIIMIACDMQPKDTLSATLLTRAVEMKDDTTHLYKVLNAGRFRKYERFLDLVCVALRDVLERVPFSGISRPDYDEKGQPIYGKGPEAQLMFAMQFARRLSEYLPRLGHPSLQKHADYFGAMYKKFEPLIAKIGTLLSEYSESGVPLDQIRQFAPSFTPRRSTKAAKKELGGNPKKKKRNKEKLKALKGVSAATKRTMDPEAIAAALRASLACDEDFLRLRRGDDTVPGSNDSKSEASTVEPEASTVEPEASTVKSDSSVSSNDTSGSKVEASASKVQASASKLQASASKVQASASKVRASTSKSEASTSKPKALVPKSEGLASKSRSSESKLSKKDKPTFTGSPDDFPYEHTSSKNENEKMVFAGHGLDSIEKVLKDRCGDVEIPRWEDLDNPMRKYGLSDEYMEELRQHLARNKDRKKGDPLTEEETRWAQLCSRDPHELSTEELHKMLTIQGVCMMGDISRDRLLRFAMKTQKMQHLTPLERLNKMVDDSDDEDPSTVSPSLTSVFKEEKRKMEEERRQEWENKSQAEKIRVEERKVRRSKYVKDDDKENPANWTRQDMDDMVSSTLEQDLFKALYEADQKKRQEEAQKKRFEETQKKKLEESIRKRLEKQQKMAESEKKEETAGKRIQLMAVQDHDKRTSTSMSSQAAKQEDQQSKLQKLCAYCMLSKPKMLKCGRCLVVHYCDRECQKAHYAEHKKACQKN